MLIDKEYSMSLLRTFVIEEFEEYAQLTVIDNKTGAEIKTERIPLLEAFNRMAVIKNCPILIEAEDTVEINLGEVA